MYPTPSQVISDRPTFQNVVDIVNSPLVLEPEVLRDTVSCKFFIRARFEEVDEPGG